MLLPHINPTGGAQHLPVPRANICTLVSIRSALRILDGRPDPLFALEQSRTGPSMFRRYCPPVIHPQQNTAPVVIHPEQNTGPPCHPEQSEGSPIQKVPGRKASPPRQTRLHRLSKNPKNAAISSAVITKSPCCISQQGIYGITWRLPVSEI